MRKRELVFKGMSCQNGLALLDIDPDLVLQPVTLQKAVNGGNVKVILVLGRFLRLRFDQNGAGEADLVLVLNDHV